MLAEENIKFLQDHGWRYELQPEGELINLIIFGYELPPGYTVTQSDLLIRLPGGFPDAPPNMFWLDPPAFFSNDSQPPGADQREEYVGRSWQRWSRHLGDSQWRPGIDNLRSYLRFIRTNLEAVVPVMA